MRRTILDDYRFQYLNDLFDIKLIFLQSVLWIAIFSIWVDATLFGASRF